MKELAFLIFLFFQKQIQNNKTDAKQKQVLQNRNNTYLDTSLETTPKFNEPWYCTKNIATPKGLSTQIINPRFIQLRGDGDICTVG